MSALKLVANVNETPVLVTVPNTNDKISAVSDLNRTFLSSKYQIVQPYFQVFKEGYTIVSEDNSETYAAERPRSWFKRFISKFVAWTAGITTFVFLFVFSLKLAPGEPAAIIAALLLGITVAIMTIKFTAPKRNATVSGLEKNELFSIKPSSGHFFFNHEYNIQSKNGHVMAIFKKRFLDNFFRIHWHCYNPNGQYLFSASEDSIIMSIIRRYFIFGKYIPIHFIFHKQGGKKFGNFTRRFSLKDKYKIDYDTNAIDGWLVVATAILLDTGEER